MDLGDVGAAPEASEGTFDIASFGGGVRHGLLRLHAGGNLGVGTIDAVHRVSIQGGPQWTKSFWKGAMAFEDGAALAWCVPGNAEHFGIGYRVGGFHFLRTMSAPRKHHSSGAQRPLAIGAARTARESTAQCSMAMAIADRAELFRLDMGPSSIHPRGHRGY
jgi:hypothetical protein